MLCQGSLYEEAIDVMERYNSLAGAQADRTRIRPPKAMRTVERLCHQLAEEHFRCVFVFTLSVLAWINMQEY